MCFPADMSLVCVEQNPTSTQERKKKKKNSDWKAITENVTASKHGKWYTKEDPRTWNWNGVAFPLLSCTASSSPFNPFIFCLLSAEGGRG